MCGQGRDAIDLLLNLDGYKYTPGSGTLLSLWLLIPVEFHVHESSVYLCLIIDKMFIPLVAVPGSVVCQDRF